MTTVKEVFGVVSGVLFFAAFVPYIRAIMRRETKPSKASWIIWATLDTTTFAGMWAVGALNGQILGAIAGAWTVVALTFKFGTPGWSKLDKFCLAGAALGIALWVAFSDPVLAIVTNMTVLVIGAIPTFASAWRDPSRENRAAWTTYWVSCVCAVIAIPHWTLADAAQPLAFTAIETTMMYVLYFRPRAIARAAA